MKVNSCINLRNNRNIGVIADSHGQPEVIEAAVDFLKNYGCGYIYHLGDICDSFIPETSASCIHLLHEHKIQAVKGNNDHAIVINHRGQSDTVIPQTTLDYLQDLPPMVEYKEAVFTHSLPFIQELGLSSMIGIMQAKWANQFFRQFPKGILFRGHEHTPEILWQQDRRIISEILVSGQTVDLTERLPCIVTCGALTQGICLIWNPCKKKIRVVSFLESS